MLNKFLTTLALVGLCYNSALAAGSMQESAQEIAQSLVSETLPGGPGTIAIGSVVHGDGTCSALSSFLEEELVDAMFNAGSSGYSIIERSQLDAIFNELELVFDGTVTPETAIQIGQIKGVRGIISGRITSFSDRILFRVRLIDTESGTIFSSARSEFPITQPVSELMAERSRAYCGFSESATSSRESTAYQSAFSTLPITSSPLGTPYSGTELRVDATAVNFSQEDGNLTASLRITNTSSKPITISYINNSYSVADDRGNIFQFTGSDFWQGVKICDSSDYSRCVGQRDSDVTLILPGNAAQLNFSLSSRDASQIGVVSIALDLILGTDATDRSEWRVETVSILDIQPN